MKIIATVLVGLLLPFTFAGSAEATHFDGYVRTNFKCMPDGDTRYMFVVNNNTTKDRFMNWSQTRTSDGIAGGYGLYNKTGTFTVRVPTGESATVSAYSRLNQKTLFLRETVVGQCDPESEVGE